MNHDVTDDPGRSPLRTHVLPILAGLLLMGAVWLLPDLASVTSQPSNVEVIHARLESISPVNPETGAQTGRVTLLEGPHRGEKLDADLQAPGARSFSTPYQPGDEVIVEISNSPEGSFAAVSDRWRLPILVASVLAFGLLVVVVGGWRGIRALIALGLTFGVALKILVPLVAAGWDAVQLAVISATAITVTTLLLTEGPSRSTLAAALGTFGALALTAVLAATVTGIAQFSQLQGNEDVGYLRMLLGADFDLGGLLLAAIILGALGVLDDVTITQAATVRELAIADPTAPRRELARQAMNVGRSHIAATVNTLVLAYVAASMPLLLIFAVGRQPPATVASTEVVAIEIVRTMVGSIGIVAAVPLTTAIAAWLTPRRKVFTPRWSD